MTVFQPPPTWADPVIVDEETKKSAFNPVWLKWFLDLVQVINDSGGGGGTITHNSTASIQGGQANQYYHLNAAQHTIMEGVFVTKLRPLTDGGAAQTVTGLMGDNGAPDNANGSNGDFYFRGDGTKAGNTVIYHKEAGAWVALVTA